MELWLGSLVLGFVVDSFFASAQRCVAGSKVAYRHLYVSGSVGFHHDV